jgi:hypothetical protein
MRLLTAVSISIKYIFAFYGHYSMVLEPVPQWDQWRAAYLDYIMRVQEKSTPKEYIAEYASDSKYEDYGDIQGIDGFERVYPANDQNIAVVMINPRLEPEGGDNEALSKLPLTDYNKRIKRSIEGSYRYLYRGRGKDKGCRIDSILESLDNHKLNTNISKQEFFDEIYYTNWYKFATSGSGDISDHFTDDVTPSFPSYILKKELSQISPNLVVTFGSYPYKALRQYCEEKPGEGITEHEGELYTFKTSDCDFKLLPFKFFQNFATELPDEIDNLYSS